MKSTFRVKATEISSMRILCEYYTTMRCEALIISSTTNVEFETFSHHIKIATRHINLSEILCVFESFQFDRITARTSVTDDTVDLGREEKKQTKRS